jgi:hypothetical protein
MQKQHYGDSAMRAIISVVLLFSLATMCVAGTPVKPKSVSETTGDYTKGRLYFPELEFDFGYVPQNAAVAHTFWLHNNGEDTLEIIQIKPSCGCTKAPLTKRLIAVNDSAEIELIFSSGRRRGQQRKEATVITSDVTKGNTRLRFFADVRPETDSVAPVRLHPSAVDIGKKDIGQKFEVNVINETDEPLTPKIVASPDDPIKFEMSTKNPILPHKSTVVTVWAAEMPDAQTVKKSITFELNDAKRSRFTIPVKIDMAVADPLKPSGS